MFNCPLASIPSSLCAGAALVVLLVAAWTPLLALAGVSATRSRPLNLLAVRQLYGLNGLSWLLLLVIGVYGLLSAMPLLPEGAEPVNGAFLGLEQYAWWHGPQRLWILVMLIGGLCEAVLSFVLARNWKRLRPNAVALGCCTALLVALLAFVGFAGQRALCLTFPVSLDGPMLSAGVLMALCGLGVCAATGLIWLLARRNRDAFGRDYYAFAARRYAKLAGWTALAALFGLMILLVLLLPLMSGLTPAPDSMSLAALRDSVSAAVLRLPERLWLVPALLVAPLLAELAFVLVARDAVPMRRKLAMLCGWLCLVLTVLLFTRLLCGLI